MNTNTAYKILTEEKGFTMEEIQAAWRNLEAAGMKFLEFRKLLRELAEDPEYRKLN